MLYICQCVCPIIQSQVSSNSDRSQLSELQSLLCAALQVGDHHRTVMMRNLTQLVLFVVVELVKEAESSRCSATVRHCSVHVIVDAEHKFWQSRGCTRRCPDDCWSSNRG